LWTFEFVDFQFKNEKGHFKYFVGILNLWIALHTKFNVQGIKRFRNNWTIFIGKAILITNSHWICLHCWFLKQNMINFKVKIFIRISQIKKYMKFIHCDSLLHCMIIKYSIRVEFIYVEHFHHSQHRRDIIAIKAVFLVWSLLASKLCKCLTYFFSHWQNVGKYNSETPLLNCQNILHFYKICVINLN